MMYSSFSMCARSVCWCAIYGCACLVFTGGSSACLGDEAFTEEAQSRGIRYVPKFAGTAGNGVAFVDLDNDGDPDLVAIGKVTSKIGLFENDGTGNFISRIDGSGLPFLPPSVASGVTACDYDNDGDQDLYFANFGVNRLLRNDGEFQFTDQTVFAGVGNQGNATGCDWADYDLDGDMDLYVGNLDYGSPALPNELYRNEGNGQFVPVGAALGVDNEDPTWHSLFLDYDRDGDADIYVSNDKGIDCMKKGGSHNYLFRNDGGVFVDITDETNAHGCADSMGIGVGDFNGSGRMDIYCANVATTNPLLVQQPDGSFLEMSEDAGVDSGEFAWGVHFLDFDNNGYLDLYACNFVVPNKLFAQYGSWPAQEVAAEMGVTGVESGSTHCLAVADVDNDGDLDLLVQSNGTNLLLYINHIGSQANAVRFDIMNRAGIGGIPGALVDLRVADQWQIREVTAGANYKSQNELTVHFGVGDALVADEVVVTWPGGDTRILTNVPTGSRWTVWHEHMLGDANHDGLRDRPDFVAFTSCHGIPFAEGCEQMDHDGDSDVDDDDFELFLSSYTGQMTDCNSNGIIDLRDILNDGSTDENSNGILDSCEHGLCDLNEDGNVDTRDLIQLLVAWGPCSACRADFDGDDSVGMFELSLVLEQWGANGS